MRTVSVIEIRNKSIWFPNYIADTVLDIEPGILRSLSVSHIVFDLDRTLVRYKANDIPPAYQRFIASLKEGGFTVLIGSNSRRDITNILDLLDVRSTIPRGLSLKPRRSFYKRLTAITGTSPSHIVMVGDHIINDTIGANLAGFRTILVRGLRGKTPLIYREYIKLIIK